MTDAVIWNGHGGRTYTFELYSIPIEFNPVSGVYVICRRVAGGFAPLYVGEAQNLFERLNAGSANHDGMKRAFARGATHISALVCNSTERLRIETELRHSLNPPCNSQSVPQGNALSMFGLHGGNK